jgi:hypothetical protein
MLNEIREKFHLYLINFKTEEDEILVLLQATNLEFHSFSSRQLRVLIYAYSFSSTYEIIFAHSLNFMTMHFLILAKENEENINEFL